MILDEILAHKRLEVVKRQAARPLSELEAAINRTAPATAADGAAQSAAGGFHQALRGAGQSVAVIAEIKRQSPSGGVLRPDASAADLATLYRASGAAALSVLTDSRYFGGTDADLVAARQASGLPTLRKDFVVDPYQVYEARALGADAVLLIVRALTDPELAALLAIARLLGLDALVEAHSADEVQRALDAGATILGVNNRDLDRLVTDPTLALRLRHLVPVDVTYVAESGISHPEQVRELAQARVHAILVGEALVRAPDPGAALRALVEAGKVLAAPLAPQP